jgi:hypothetical protein
MISTASKLAIAFLAAPAIAAAADEPPAAERAIMIARQNAIRLEADQFARTDAADQLVGLPVNITMSVETPIYRDGQLLLFVDAGTVYPNGNGDIDAPGRFDHYPTVVFSKESKGKGSYRASNAYGASAEVSVIDIMEKAVLLANRPDDDAFVFKAPLDGPAAKALSDAARLVITGTVAKTSNGLVSRCDDHASPPTLDVPVSGKFQTCWVAVKVDRIAFVNSTTGATLREWTAGSPKASILDEPSD